TWRASGSPGTRTCAASCSPRTGSATRCARTTSSPWSTTAPGGGSWAMNLSRAAAKKLGNLAGRAEDQISDLIVERGGNASNIRQAGHWAGKKLGEAAEAAARGDRSAETAIKIVKQARRLGEEH